MTLTIPHPVSIVSILSGCGRKMRKDMLMLYTIFIQFSKLLCNRNLNDCSQHCSLHYHADEEEAPVFDRRMSCVHATEIKNEALITTTSDMHFSGVTYDDKFYPSWILTINGTRYTSEDYKLKHLAVNGDNVYDIKKDDIRTWWYLNRDALFPDILRDMNDYHYRDGYFIAEIARRKNIPLPDSDRVLYSFLTTQVPQIKALVNDHVINNDKYVDAMPDYSEPEENI